LEQVIARVIDECADRPGVPDGGDRRRIAPSLNPAISGRRRPRAPISAIVVGEQVECDHAAGVLGSAAPAGVGSDQAELLGQRFEVRLVSERHACPDRVRRDHPAVQQHQRLARASLDVVDVDAVGVDAAVLALIVPAYSSAALAGAVSGIGGIGVPLGRLIVV
jgi:hypothetical protein